MSAIDDKRKEIIEALSQKIEEQGLDVQYSSPRVRCFYIGPKTENSRFIRNEELEEMLLYGKEGEEEIIPVIADAKEPAAEEAQEETFGGEPEAEITEEEEDADAEEFDEEEDIDYENLSPREFKRLKKEQRKREKYREKEQAFEERQREKEQEQEEKERLKEEKRLTQIRRDAHKRGYDTTVLMQFEDPEELYELSDKEIDQMQAAGYINEDGFYDFVFPEDAAALKREQLSTKKKLIIAGLCILGIGIVAWIFVSIYSVF